MPREVSTLKKHIEEAPKLRELREKRKAKKKRIAVWIAAGCVLVFGGVVYAAHLSRFAIRTITVVGNQVVDTDDVVATANAQLNGSYGYLIPRKNALVYPKQAIVRAVTAAFPRFKSVVVNRTDMHTIVITVSELRGHALWCGATATIDMQAPCWFTDDSGKIVSAAPQYSGNVYPRFFGGTLSASDAGAPLGKTFLDTATFQNLITFDQQLVTAGFSVKGITLGADEYDIVLDLGKGGTAPVRFKPATDFTTIEQNLGLALAKPELADLIKKDKVNLEYLDLRFDNKVYYKFSDRP